MPSWKKVITSGSSAHLNELTSSTFLVDGNKSGQFIAVIDNDENSSGHVLKLATDGTGNGTHVLDMENGNNTMFRARADGRFAFGNSAVGSMGAGTFVVGIDGGHTSDIAISKRLQHFEPILTVAMIHKLRDNFKSSFILELYWESKIKNASFLAPNGPEVCPGNPQGRQWFDIFNDNDEKVLDGINQAYIDLKGFIDEKIKLSKHIANNFIPL